MNKVLKIKDSVFGYIPIDDDDVYFVLNSAMFHRLQDIIQTSYTSVYPSAVHDRFIHSLGVYYLGKIAAEKLKKNIINNQLVDESEIDKLCKAFILACLMHDSGHSPFSHTGEKFYILDSEDNPKIWKELVQELIDDSNLETDANGKMKGKAHEVMSALISLKKFPQLFEGLDKSFFARCIIGLKYTDRSNIKNCFIELLNSDTIDVDKLDYLIRDSYFTGFNTIKIDYERLLNSVCIIKNDNFYELGFEKAALSTLESVILAHDMERKWIQNHPVIKYEDLLITYILSKVQEHFSKKGIDIFVADALSESGIGTEPDRILLLSDSDINSYAKRFLYDDPKVKEYYSRNLRKKSLWKSESEYLLNIALRGCDGDLLQELENRITSLEKFLVDKLNFPVLNDEALEFLKSECDTEFLPDNFKVAKKQEMEKSLAIITFFKDYAKKSNIPFEFVVVSANQFATGFNKINFKEIKVKFSENKFEKLDKILNLVSANEVRKNFFYVMVDCESKQKIDINDFSTELVTFILREYNKK